MLSDENDRSGKQCSGDGSDQNGRTYRLQEFRHHDPDVCSYGVHDRQPDQTRVEKHRLDLSVHHAEECGDDAPDDQRDQEQVGELLFREALQEGIDPRREDVEDDECCEIPIAIREGWEEEQDCISNAADLQNPQIECDENGQAPVVYWIDIAVRCHANLRRIER